MVDLAGQPERARATRKAVRISPTDMDELVAFCPNCKAFETLWFSDDSLVPTRKFLQIGRRVYHDCGSDEACRLLLRFVKQ